MKKLALSNLNSLYNAINDKMKLYLPIENNGAVNFGEYSDGANVNLNKMTIKSAKGWQTYYRRARGTCFRKFCNLWC